VHVHVVTHLKVPWDKPINAMVEFLKYFVFSELFTINLLCRCSFWEQCQLWPEVTLTASALGVTHILYII